MSSVHNLVPSQGVHLLERKKAVEKLKSIFRQNLDQLFPVTINCIPISSTFGNQILLGLRFLLCYFSLENIPFMRRLSNNMERYRVDQSKSIPGIAFLKGIPYSKRNLVTTSHGNRRQKRSPNSCTREQKWTQGGSERTKKVVIQNDDCSTSR